MFWEEFPFQPAEPEIKVVNGGEAVYRRQTPILSIWPNERHEKRGQLHPHENHILREHALYSGKSFS
jgi:hypothetical protein